MNSLDNINELNNLDPLDLAFLFLDGEANETEKRILFEELSKDENLQKDFQEAIEMKYAGIEEAKDLTPPIGLTNAIYGTLGVGAAHTVGNLTQNYGGNYFSGLVNSAGSFISPIYMMITSFILGGAISYFALQGIENKQTVTQTKSQNIAQNVFPNTNNNLTQNTEKIIPITQSSETKNENISSSKKSIYNQKTMKQFYPEVEGVSIANKNIDKITIDTINNILISKIDNMPILTPNENIDYKLQVITPIETNDKMNIIPLDNSIATIRIDTLGNRQTTNIDPSNITTSKINPFTTEKIIPVVNDNIVIMPNKSQDYEVKIITINSMTYFQNKPNFTDNNTNFNNIQATGLYKISDNQKVGLSIGNEDYPRYVKSGNEFVLTNDLTYYGGVYNYNFLDVNFAGNIKSNVNLLLGFASESLVNKSGIEINWKPDSKLSLNLGIETLLNVANYRNAYEYTSKLNFYYGVSYNF